MLVAHAMPTDELTSLARENAEARLPYSEQLCEPLECRLWAHEERDKRQRRSGAEIVERGLDGGVIAFPTLDGHLACFLPRIAIVDAARKLCVVLLSQRLLSAKNGPKCLRIGRRLSLARCRDSHE